METKITAILVDDETIIRNGMKALINTYTPEIDILGEADSVASAYKMILKLQPKVVFLDIQMNDGSGFDVLQKILDTQGEISFHIIFITAYEQYALKAFKYSALDYLLKPIDLEDLKKVVDKLKKIIQLNTQQASVHILLDNMEQKPDSFAKLVLSTAEGQHIIDIKDIIHCESQDNYTLFHIKNQKPILISNTLKVYEELLADKGFVRIHQSHLINTNEIKSYSKRDSLQLEMSDATVLPISIRKKEKIQKLMNSESRT